MSKNLTFKLVMDADTKAFVSNMHQSEKAAKDAFAALKSGSASIVGDTSSATKEVDQLGTQSQETAQQVKQLDKELEATSQELQQTEQSSKGVSGELQGLKTGFNALTGALAALGIGTTAMEIAQTADEYKNLSGRLSIAIGEHGNLQKAMDDVKNVAINTNSNLTATGDLYARLTKIGQEMKWPQEQALALTETINKATQVGGGSAASTEAALTQMQQALSAGILRGDEFNSMMEQSPRLTQALADGLGVTTGKLREMAGEGQLTTDVVTKALLSQSEVISAEFAKFPTTIGASIENLKTAWTVYIGEADAASGASAKVAEAIKFVAQNLDLLVTALTTAAQAYIAYKALGMSAALLEKANSARIASAAIQQETTTIVTNTQAQIANANATKVAAIAKTQLTTATNASTVANTAAAGGFSRVTTAANGLKTGLVSVLSRFGAYGVAAAGIVMAGDLIIDSLKKVDEWLIRQGSNFIDWAVSRATGTKSLAEQEREWIATQEESRKKQEELTATKAEITAAAEKARDKTYQLTEESKKLIAEFDELIKKGEPTKEALEKISNAMKFDSTKGINDSITALIALKDQGKITADELQVDLGKALDGKDLLVFETNARAAFAGTSKEAEKNAQITEAVMKAALERTGLSTEQLQGKFSQTFQSASNDVQIVIDNLDAYKAQGIDTGLALSANLNKAIDTAQTRAELDYAKSKLIELEKQGVITGDQVALGLSKIEQKANQLPAALNPAIAAFNALGIKTKDQLNDAAVAAQKNFDVVSKSGQATADGVKQAYTQMLNAAIASGNKAQIAAVQAKAASHGLTVEISDTGKAIVQTTSEWVKANVGVDNSIKAIKNSYREVGRVALEEAKSSTEAWAEALNAAREADKVSAGAKKTVNRGYYTENEIRDKVLSSGEYTFDQAEEIAKRWLSEYLSKGNGGNRDEFINKYGLTNATYIDEQLQRMKYGSSKGKSISSGPVNLNDYAPSIPSAPSVRDIDSSPKTTIRIEAGNGQYVDAQVNADQVNPLTQILKQLGTLKGST